MKLSICIPVFNFDVSELVFALKKQIQDNALEAEILLIDDASGDTFTKINKNLVTEVQEFVFLKENIGRSRIRNLFLNYSKGDYLLFLDCDAKIDNEKFLNNYLKEINENSGVELIYGNFKISDSNQQTLRNQYSLQREIMKEDRSESFSFFKTVNFVVKREVFKNYPFDESLKHYGYEDFIFAQKMKLGKVKYIAINNPVVHYDDTSNAVFLDKTKIAINTLFTLSQEPKNVPLIKDVKLYSMALDFKKKGIKPLFLFIYKCFEKKITSNLKSEQPNIHYFDMYKLKLLLKKI